MTVRLSDASIIPAVANILQTARGGNGTLRVIVPTHDGKEAQILAGRDFTLDAELALLIERVAGEGNVDLSVQEPPRLALVG